MQPHANPILLMFGIALFLLSGCQESSGARACPPGEETCACRKDKQCDEGLFCSSDVCTADGASDPATGDSDRPSDSDIDEDSESDTPSDSDDGADTDTDSAPVYDIVLREPITRDIYTADPSAHVFDGTLYVYPSHDQDTAFGDYNMVDYHVFSLASDGRFIDHGMILHVDDVPWAVEKMWAPDAAYRDGTYYFYFPAMDRQGIFRIGVARGPSPTGPFTPEPEPIDGSFSMDPAVFIDDDETAYMYFGGLWGGQLECWQRGVYDARCVGPSIYEPALGPRVVALNSDMIRFGGPIEEIIIVDSGGTALTAGDENRRFFEGPWMHKHKGTYYLSYSTGSTHRLVYATNDRPTGTFTYRGVLLPNHNSGWTTHHSVVEYKGNWYLFYHDASCSGGVDARRCVKVADLHHNGDGSIQTVSLR